MVTHKHLAFSYIVTGGRSLHKGLLIPPTPNHTEANESSSNGSTNEQE